MLNACTLILVGVASSVSDCFFYHFNMFTLILVGVASSVSDCFFYHFNMFILYLLTDAVSANKFGTKLISLMYM